MDNDRLQYAIGKLRKSDSGHTATLLRAIRLSADEAAKDAADMDDRSEYAFYMDGRAAALAELLAILTEGWVAK